MAKDQIQVVATRKNNPYSMATVSICVGSSGNDSKLVIFGYNVANFKDTKRIGTLQLPQPLVDAVLGGKRRGCVGSIDYLVTFKRFNSGPENLLASAKGDFASANTFSIVPQLNEKKIIKLGEKTVYIASLRLILEYSGLQALSLVCNSQGYPLLLFGTSGHESVYTKQEVLSVGLKPGEMFSFEEWLKALSNGVKDSLEKFERLEADWLIK